MSMEFLALLLLAFCFILISVGIAWVCCVFLIEPALTLIWYGLGLLFSERSEKEGDMDSWIS